MEIEHSEVQDSSSAIIDTNLELQTITEDASTKDTVPAKPSEDRLVQLPLARVRNIMKLDPEIPLLSQDAVFAVTKATEMFIEELAKEAYNYTIKSKKKTLQKKDVDNAIDNIDCLVFLEGAMNF